MDGASEALVQLLAEIDGGMRPDAAGFHCAASGDAWRLGIWGRLAPSWVGNVSLHCHAGRISILEGDAVQVRRGVWAGSFLLRATASGASPRGLDFLRMARRRPSVIPDLGAPEVLELAVQHDRERQIHTVRIVGRDQLGFLAHLLGSIASCELEPSRIALHTTRDGYARDAFELVGIGGSAPAHAALARLESILRG